MKKITLFLFLIISSFGFSQSWTTGEVMLASDFSVQFDITSSTVTVTMIGPSSVGFAVSPTNDAYSQGSGMGQFSGDDVIFYANGIVSDRQQTGGFSQPQPDGTNNPWSISSNTVNGSARTVVASRARNTGDSADFVFPDSVSSFTVIWAKGGNADFTFHPSGTSGRSGTIVNTVLSNEDFQLNPARFVISPNPSNRDLNVGINYNSSRAYNLEVYDVLGKQIYRGHLTKDNNSIDASNWRRGVYLVKLSSDEATQTKRFVKQ
ncbi:putative secreted protein (Por secretion system target) [Winogradskyella wandonensis]|uniref:Putative secreted protein (Por secretion system target) n=1 Tax=Winogradskyella wandonensis TaxID=1442586 RepID=A0A4R1KUS2_9FLAO|nr:T9SS type A sorting domain-containing protein [Winogradskyella wandonensis]TCK68928.1 putative secreted protein (Por secretion system target) [Winogradskyella wandonensis]